MLTFRGLHVSHLLSTNLMRRISVWILNALQNPAPGQSSGGSAPAGAGSSTLVEVPGVVVLHRLG